jgi:hypothetical protein
MLFFWLHRKKKKTETEKEREQTETEKKGNYLAPWEEGSTGIFPNKR